MEFSQHKQDVLDSLFQTLKTERNKKVIDETVALIWSEWMQSGVPKVDDMMDKGVDEMHSKQYAEAVRTFTDIVEEMPTHSEAWNKRATVYYLKGEWKKSIQDIEKTLALEPRHFGALSGLATIYLEIGNEKGALKTYEQLLDIYPYQPVLRRQVQDLRDKLGFERS